MTWHIALPFLYLKVKGYCLFHISGGGGSVVATFHISTGPKSPFSLRFTLQPDVHSQRDIINTLSLSIAQIRSGFTHFLRFVELVFMIKVSYLEALWQAGDVLACEELKTLGTGTAGPSGRRSHTAVMRSPR